MDQNSSQEVISKKQLLADTGISYGQLYRWKRERLIPEEWFMKQASYTGQETFFPKEQMLQRIAAIMEMKDQHSLEELAKLLTPEAEANIGKEKIRQLDELGPERLDIVLKHFDNAQYRMLDVAFMACVCRAAQRSGMTDAELESVIIRSVPAIAQQKQLDATCVVFKAGDYHVLLCNERQMTFDDGIEVVLSELLSETASHLQLKYQTVLGKQA